MQKEDMEDRFKPAFEKFMATPEAEQALRKAFEDTVRSITIREFFMNEGAREQEKVRQLEHEQSCLHNSIENLKKEAEIRKKILLELDNGIITSRVMKRCLGSELPNNLNDTVICPDHSCLGCSHNDPHKYMSVDSDCDGGGDNDCPACVIVNEEQKKEEKT
jgi:hypothetical protein